MTKEELLNMKLHEIVKITSLISIVRVLGGWIYAVNGSQRDGTDYGVFVPETLNVYTKSQ